jgi:hypothetical protein
MRSSDALTALERAAWQRLAEAELAVQEARENVIRITNLEHARRTRRLRLVSLPAELRLATDAAPGQR